MKWIQDLIKYTNNLSQCRKYSDTITRNVSNLMKGVEFNLAWQTDRHAQTNFLEKRDMLWSDISTKIGLAATLLKVS